MLDRFILLPHKSDLKIRVYGKDLQELFTNALIGMFTLIKPITDECVHKNNNINNKKFSVEDRIEVNSYDLESLLVDFLSEAITLSDIYYSAYFDVEFEEITKANVKAIIRGVHVKGFESGEIKGVTHHDLKIEDKGDHWEAEILFDM